MRLARVRCTVRRMMVGLAFVAIAFAFTRPIYFQMRADIHWKQSGEWSKRAGGMPICKLAFLDLSPDELYLSIENSDYEPSREAYLRTAIAHRFLAMEYERAASDSWFSFARVR
jgi:hypothetical protein